MAYAYAKGYTKGVDQSLMHFGSENVISAREYLTFLLRALGYRDSGASPDFAWDTATEQARALGVITQGEQALLAADRPPSPGPRWPISPTIVSQQAAGRGEPAELSHLRRGGDAEPG